MRRHRNLFFKFSADFLVKITFTSISAVIAEQQIKTEPNYTWMYPFIVTGRGQFNIFIQCPCGSSRGHLGSIIFFPLTFREGESALKRCKLSTTQIPGSVCNHILPASLRPTIRVTWKRESQKATRGAEGCLEIEVNPHLISTLALSQLSRRLLYRTDVSECVLGHLFPSQHLSSSRHQCYWGKPWQPRSPLCASRYSACPSPIIM